MNWFLVFACVGAILIALGRWAWPPYRFRKVRLGDLERYLDALLWRGFENGFMVIDVPAGSEQQPFLQFTKYIKPSGVSGLEFVFPLADWSEPYYTICKAALLNNNVAFETRSRSRDEVPESIFADTEQDLGLAQKICTVTVLEVFGIDEDCVLDVTLHNVSPRNVRHGH